MLAPSHNRLLRWHFPKRVPEIRKGTAAMPIREPPSPQREHVSDAQCRDGMGTTQACVPFVVKLGGFGWDAVD
jgi:hypothetical protein